MLNISKNRVKEELDDFNLYSTRLVNTPGRRKIIRKWLVGIFLFSVSCLFLPWQQNIRGNGVVTAFRPQDRPQEVQSIIAGRIEEWYIREGQQVKKGDSLILLSEIKEKFFDPEIIERTSLQVEAKEQALKSKQEKVKSLENQIRAIQNGLSLSLAKAKNKVRQSQLKVKADSAELENAKIQEKTAYEQLQRQEKLFKEGLKSRTDLEQRSLKYQETVSKLVSAENKYQVTLNELINASIELNSIEAEYLDKISKAESEMNATFSELFETRSELSKQKIELSNLIVRKELYVIRAPQDGYIIKAKKAGIGETLKDGDEVVTIMPMRPELSAEIYVTALDAAILYTGAPVRVQFEGWPALVFSGWPDASVGTFGGIVKVIDFVSSEKGKFRILVVPDPKQEPWPAQLRIGSGVTAWALLNKVLVGYELWRQFNGFPPELYEDLNHKKEQKKSKKVNQE